jgi:hypothetical protein
MSNVIWRLMASASAMIIFPALGLAQFGAIAGTVRDTSGSVVPDARVEASSPALIEKSRTAVSDASGQYRIEQLRPGTYSVTFTKAGFSTVKQDGIEISAGFTAPINADLRVGGVQDTITVEAQAPVVDVQDTAEEKTLVKDEVDSLPTAKSFATLGTTLPSVSQNQNDVGGSQGEKGNVLFAHGGLGADMSLQVDGVPFSIMATVTSLGNANSTFSLNDAGVQEMQYETSAISMQSASGGVYVNVIPREGSNAFHLEAYGNFANNDMEANNFTATEKAQGLTSVPRFDSLHDDSVGFGGPIIKDRVWFWYAQRYRENDSVDVQTFYSINPLSPLFNPNLAKPGHYGGFDGDNQLRVTAQVTQRNKLSFFFDKANKCNCPIIVDNPVFTAEAESRLTYPSIWLGAVTWQAIITPKLIWDLSLSYNHQDDQFIPLASDVTATSPIALLDVDGVHELRAPAPGTFTGGEYQRQAYVIAGLSYTTGRHDLRVGMNYHWGHRASPTYETSDDVSYTTYNGVPLSVTLYDAPYVQKQDINADLGVYAQDKWTLRRLTLTGGVRWDYFNSSIPAQTTPADIWIPARSFAAVPNVPNWNDIDPRFGAAYDLFGNHKTALKASVSRYVSTNIYTFGYNIDPISAGGGNTLTRAVLPTTNIDAPPIGNPLNTAPNGDYSGPGASNFGQSVLTTTYDPNLSSGWGKRPYSWEYTAQVQHQLAPNIAIDGGYFRRTYGNQTVTNNLQITPADFDTFCLTLPNAQGFGSYAGSSQAVARLAGSQLCGLADINPAFASLTSHQQVTFAKNFPGQNSQVYNGFDLNINAHPTGRFFLLAGLSIGRTISNMYTVAGPTTPVVQMCSVVDNPMNQLFCQSRQPFQGQYRVTGGYTFPWRIQFSVVYQSIPPAGFQPYYTVTNTSQDTLGRPLVEGSINVPVSSPYAFFTDRVNQVDIRVTKTISFEAKHLKGRVDLMADVYNVFNTSPVLSRNAAIGPTFYTPTAVLQGAFLKLGGRVTF